MINLRESREGYEDLAVNALKIILADFKKHTNDTVSGEYEWDIDNQICTITVYVGSSRVGSWNIDRSEIDDITFLHTISNTVSNLSRGFEPDIAETVVKESFQGATKLEKGEGSTFKNAGTVWKVITQNDEDTLIVALNDNEEETNRYVVAWGLQKDGSWNQGHYFDNKAKALKFFNERAKKSESLEESKSVFEGNSQTAGSFVNIDVDIDNMEISDYIVRLAQAIRSEQTAVLEYTALMADNELSEDDKSVIEGIMEEEKNHMCALTTLMYKQILQEHKDNMDEAKDEFTLPDLAALVTANNDNINESLDKVLTKIEKTLKEDKNIDHDITPELAKAGYSIKSNKNGEIIYASDVLYSPDIEVFGNLVEIIPLNSSDLPVSMTVEDHGKMLLRLMQIQKLIETL